MSKSQEKNIGMKFKKNENFSEWYNEVVQKAELADYSQVKGFMVIRPNGYFIWEQIQDFLNEKIKKIGVSNAYFPLFIPESFFQKEAEHAEGFSPEVAWIQKKNEEGERLAVRPTSETIMYDQYGKWIRSHKDLPLKINQWCNVVRWETKSTKLFLRTREFLWQEGHCVYETNEECSKETDLYLEKYRQVAEELTLIPVIKGKKTDFEKFAGADYTTTIEGIMPDGKALQMGTSHNLGQNFGKAFGISFKGKDEKEHLPWQNSWGMSTRMIGAVIMTHGDDKGLVLPPKLALKQIVIVPIIFGDTKDQVLAKCEEVGNLLSEIYRVHVDDRDDYSSGWKFNEWELKGVPIRIEIGPKDIEKEQVVIVRRDTGAKEFVKFDEINAKMPVIITNMEKDMFEKAKQIQESLIHETQDWKEFEDIINKQEFVKTYFCNETACEEEIKDKNGATTRCIPFEDVDLKDKVCVYCKKPAKVQIYFAKAY
jgi:prolyl-tRNA synthetase